MTDSGKKRKRVSSRKKKSDGFAIEENTEQAAAAVVKEVQAAVVESQHAADARVLWLCLGQSPEGRAFLCLAPDEEAAHSCLETNGDELIRKKKKQKIVKYIMRKVALDNEKWRRGVFFRIDPLPELADGETVLTEEHLGDVFIIEEHEVPLLCSENQQGFICVAESEEKALMAFRREIKIQFDAEFDILTQNQNTILTPKVRPLAVKMFAEHGYVPV